MRIHGAVASVCLIVLGCQGAGEGGDRGLRPVDGPAQQAAQQGAQQAVQGPTLTARILGPEGQPAEGVDVWLLAGVESPDAFIRAKIAAAATGDLVETMGMLAVAAARTDDTGQAGLALVGAESPGMLVARSESGFAQLEVPVLSPGKTPVMTLEPMGTARIRVVGPAGSPVAGLPVSVALRDENGGLEMLPITAATDEDGTATLRWPRGTLPQSGRVEVVAVARLASAEPCLTPLPAPGSTGAIEVPEVRQLGLRVPRLSSKEGRELPLSGIVTVFPAAHGSRSDATLGTLIDADAIDLGPVASGETLNAVAVLAFRGDPGKIRLIGRVEWPVPPEDVASGELTIPLDDYTCVTARIRGAADGEVIDVRIPGRPRSDWKTTAHRNGEVHWLVRGRGPTRILVGFGDRVEPIDVELPAGGKTLDLGAIFM